MAWLEVIAIVASILTVVTFVFSVWQYVRAKAGEQALRSIHAVCQAGFIEAHLLHDKAETEDEKTKFRILGAYFSSILNSCMAFLNVTRKRFEKPSLRDQAFVYMDDEELLRNNDSVMQSDSADK